MRLRKVGLAIAGVVTAIGQYRAAVGCAVGLGW